MPTTLSQAATAGHTPPLRPFATSGRELQTLAGGYLARLQGWIERSRQRTALRELAGDEHLLYDIGKSRQEALREAGKPFWRP
jgi:uncharacterized protein YjiS (DUF1127 family)